MRRTVPVALGEPEVDDDMEVMSSSPSRRPQLRTEFDFQLPRGYLDGDGALHRSGTMRLATARDELLPLYDARVQENPAYTTVVLLSRVITSLGTLPGITSSVVENMFASDVAFLQDLYRRINADGHTEVAVACPHCGHDFAVDVAGDAPGGS